jgi:hypothetical protein
MTWAATPHGTRGPPVGGSSSRPFPERDPAGPAGSLTGTVSPPPVGRFALVYVAILGMNSSWARHPYARPCPASRPGLARSPVLQFASRDIGNIGSGRLTDDASRHVQSARSGVEVASRKATIERRRWHAFCGCSHQER